MVHEDDTHIIRGPSPLHPVSKQSLGQLVYDSLMVNRNTHEALVDAETKKTITYREILGLSCSLAQSLIRSGYGKNSIFSISSENSIHFFIPIISSLYLGAIMTPMNQNYTETELTHILNISKPRVVFSSRKVADKYIHLKDTLKFIEKIIIIDSDEDVRGAETLNNFINQSLKGYSLLYRHPIAEIDPSEQVAFVLCSSGTTGLPKGVMLTHENLMVRYMHTLDPRYCSKNKNFLGLLPFFHAYGLISNLFAMVQSEKIVVIKQFSEKLFLQTLQDYKISNVWVAPPLVVFLAKSPLVDRYDLSSIEELACGAAPLSKETEETVKKRLMIKSIRQGYGLTECTLAVTVMGVGDTKFGSSGKVVTYMSCKVRDPTTGKSLGPNQIGELCFKGPMVMKGYFGNKEATRNCFTPDGWLLSGDLGYYDQDEYFFIVDRLKELIKYKGFQVAPAELEALLLTNPKIKDCGVVGLAREDVGELPVAFVVKRPNEELSGKEVEDFVAGRVSSQKWLRGGVIFIPEIPKNPSGKILRRELRGMLSKKAKL